MKTLKELKKECELFYRENAAIYFAASFSKKMGGTQTLTFEDNFIETIEIDRREYYQGRGAKYNSPSIHEHINVFISIIDFYAKVNLRAKNLFDRQKEKQIERKIRKEFCDKLGLNFHNYSGYLKGMDLFFKKENKSKVESELGVNLTEFFQTSGKTYYFAESKIGLLEFFHNNHQIYSFTICSEEERAKFTSKREEWTLAPYAELVGQTNNPNLFVC